MAIAVLPQPCRKPSRDMLRACWELIGAFMLAVRLPSDIEDRLEKLARRTGRTKTFYAQQAIVAHLDELEDTYLALSRLK
jgi:TraY domain